MRRKQGYEKNKYNKLLKIKLSKKMRQLNFKKR